MRTSTAVPVLSFRTLCTSDEHLHAMRYHWFPKDSGPESSEWYSRDCVVFGLIHGGEGELAEPHGRLPLEAGCLYAVAPGQVYRVRPRPVLGLWEMRVILRADWALALGLRHAGSMSSAPWEHGPLTSLRRLDDAGMQWFSDWVEQLMRDRVDELMAETFCLDVMHRWRRQPIATTAGAPVQALPAWLRTALIEMTASGNLQAGVGRLAQLAGRSARHVNRLCQQHLGCSSTELINRLRMEYAARKLRLGDNNIAEIAEIVGLRNRSYFTKLFTRTYGLSPGRYRQTRR